MKISELIKHLQEYINLKGDEDISIEYPENPWSTRITYNVSFRDCGILEVNG